MLSDDVAELFAEAQLLNWQYRQIVEPPASKPIGRPAKPIQYWLTPKAYEELQRRRRAREALHRRQADALPVRVA